ncbi:hypothetical protein [Sphingomonas paucimobilis]|uniref:hypothetical protein n=1 Tax=Sphingomonas paucimobilis TaxID=13689 RepID=UPI00137913E5|nr:hypothetical protein [Sphingomonas paucimobilis]
MTPHDGRAQDRFEWRTGIRAWLVQALAMLIAASSGSSAGAQATAPPDPGPVVDTTRPLLSERETLRGFAAIAGYSASHQPFSSLTRPVCIASRGLATNVALPIAEHIPGNAERLGMKLGRLYSWQGYRTLGFPYAAMMRFIEDGILAGEKKA